MLESWNDGDAKARIVEFVRAVTTPGDEFVPPESRIATFDNDGTLWVEKPRYAQAEFVLRRRNQTDEVDSASPKAAAGRGRIAGGRAKLAAMLDRLPDLLANVSEVTRGLSTEAYEGIVREFFDTATHPALGVPYTQLAYRPMTELIRFLEANQFLVYICTGGGRDFVRVVSEELYGIPRDRVIGSAGAIEYRNGGVYRKAGIELPIDDGPGKPVHIWQRTGRMPLFACGNANGDAEMLQSAKFSVLINHDDSQREFAYAEGAEKVLAMAQFAGWTVVSMKDDFLRVF